MLTFANNFLNVLPCSRVKLGHIEDYVGSYCQWFWEVRREETLTVHTKTLRCTHDSCWHTVNTRWQSLDIDPGCRQEQSKICVWEHTHYKPRHQGAHVLNAGTQSEHGDTILISQGLSAKLFERGQQPPVSAVVGVQGIETTGRRLSKTGAVCEMNKATTQCSKVMHERWTIVTCTVLTYSTNLWSSMALWCGSRPAAWLCWWWSVEHVVFSRASYQRFILEAPHNRVLSGWTIVANSRYDSAKAATALIAQAADSQECACMTLIHRQ
jgi:hypothetical protein